jgi:hypothetical protein
MERLIEVLVERTVCRARLSAMSGKEEKRMVRKGGQEYKERRGVPRLR